MSYRFSDLTCKDVINIKDGTCIGSVDDIEIDQTTSKVMAIVVYGRKRFFGLFGRDEDIVILWKYIEIIGEDAILVCFDNFQRPTPKRRQLFQSLFQ